MGKYFWTEAFVTNTHVQYTYSALKTLTPHRTHITEYLQVRNLEQMTVKRHIGAFQHARTHTHNLLTFPLVSLPPPRLFPPIYINCVYAYTLTNTYANLNTNCAVLLRAVPSGPQSGGCWCVLAWWWVRRRRPPHLAKPSGRACLDGTCCWRI